MKRSLHQAVVALLTVHFGKHGAQERLEGVKIPGTDDTREVVVDKKDIARLMTACPETIRPLVATAILTAIDMTPLLNLRVRDFTDGDPATLRVPDKKTKARRRVVVLSSLAASYLRDASRGRSGEEILFGVTHGQLRGAWRKLRIAIGRTDLRFKDLRHLLPTVLAAQGVDRKTISALMGHAPGSRITDRYITPAGGIEELDRAANELGVRYLEVA